ncbi:MAG: hypothetical protein ACFCU6_03935 [Balneolaceae bacterium]
MTQENQILKKVYSLALELNDLAPWQWMYEYELFGIKLPHNHQTYYASIMGSAGEYSAVSFYEGDKAAVEFLQLQEKKGAVRPDEILLIPYLMISFNDRSLLEDTERKRLKKLGFSLSDRSKWPVIHQNIPGHPPAFPHTTKLSDLLPLLEQTIHVARQAQKKEFAFIERTGEHLSGLFRVQDTKKKSGGWSDEYFEFQPGYKQLSIPYPGRLAAKLSRLPQQNIILEVDLSLLPNPVMDKNPPYFPFALMLVEKSSGHIVNVDLLTPHPNVDEMFAYSGMQLIEALVKQKLHPKEIRIRSGRLYPVFKKVLEATPVRLTFKQHLPAVEDALASLTDYMR